MCFFQNPSKHVTSLLNWWSTPLLWTKPCRSWTAGDGFWKWNWIWIVLNKYTNQIQYRLYMSNYIYTIYKYRCYTIYILYYIHTILYINIVYKYTCVSWCIYEPLSIKPRLHPGLLMRCMSCSAGVRSCGRHCGCLLVLLARAWHHDPYLKCICND